MIVHTETGKFGVRQDRLYFVLFCRLFKSAIGGSSTLSQVTGWSSEMEWKKHYDQIPECVNSVIHW